MKHAGVAISAIVVVSAAAVLSACAYEPPPGYLPYYYYYPPPQAYYAAPPAGAPAQKCQAYDGQVTIDGSPQQLHGTACQQADGRWRLQP
jgi:surface antigen